MAQENMMREALRKFHKGDGVTDEELKGLLDFFKRAEGVLNEMTMYFDRGYSFAHENARRNLEALKCFKRARLKKNG